MKIVDLNVLLYAVNRDAPQHRIAREFWEAAINGEEPIGLAWMVVLGFLRLSTRPGVFASPLTAEQAAAAAAPATATARKKKGLSDFEKAVLIGLGAVAVGAILSNNRRVAANSGDRVVVERQDGSYEVIKDDDALLRQPGSAVRTERFRDGSVRTTVTRSDGSRIITIRDAGYRVLRRVHIDPDGRQTVLIDDTAAYDPVVVSQLPPPRKPREVSLDDEMALRLALEQDAPRVGRRFSLAQVRGIPEVRALAPAIDLREITFETGSSAIRPDQARVLSTLGRVSGTRAVASTRPLRPYAAAVAAGPRPRQHEVTSR